MYRYCSHSIFDTVKHAARWIQRQRPFFAVDWFQARTYASWAGKRLPTEAEWELAVRNGTTTVYPWGDSWVPGNANAMGTYRADGWGGTAPVASFASGGWGIYDLVGNAAEWMDDVFNESYYGAPRDGRAWHQETGLAGERRRVVRGGGYDDPPQRQRRSTRVLRATASRQFSLPRPGRPWHVR